MASRVTDKEGASSGSSSSNTDVEAPNAASGPDGCWGEERYKTQDRVDVKRGRKDFEDLARTLSTASGPRKNMPPAASTASDETARDVEAGTAGHKGKAGSEEDEGEHFDLKAYVQNRRTVLLEHGIESDKAAGVVWKHLTVKGVGSSTSFVKTLPKAVLGTFGPDAFNFLLNTFPFLGKVVPGVKVPVRELISDFNGSLKEEMLLVLGRPGSGCSTFLRAIANQRSGFAAVEGEVTYGGITAKEAARKFRGEVTYTGEDDQHFPTLTVGQTLRFALKNKVPRKRPAGESPKEFVEKITKLLLRMFAISHTEKTVVGNEFVRGVSGGERKRVSIAETLAAKSSIACWDNSTRGLDSSTALEYARSLRILTDVAKRTTVATLYQAGENIYDLFDKVLLIDEGRCIYFGPAKEARQYFHELGFYSPQSQTTADFLTSITDPVERRVREGFEKTAPQTCLQREEAFKNSELYKRSITDIEAYHNELHETGGEETQRFKTVVRQDKSKGQAKSSSYTVSFPSSVWALTQRQFLLKWGDREAFYTKTITNVSIALIVSSMFYNQPANTSGAFSRGGALFFSLLFLGWLNLAEIGEAMQGRPIISRHRQFAFHPPAAISIARVVCDLPINLFQTILFTIIFYFIANLYRSAGAFFIYFLFVFICTMTLTAFYRAVAALSSTFDTAIRFSVIGLNVAIVFVGYVIPRQDMPNYFRWISYVQPLSYAFEALISNEFSNLDLPCSDTQTVPNIPGAQVQYQTCAITGARPGSLMVNGNDYIGESYGYTRAHLWPNFGYICGFLAAYIAAGALFTELFNFAGAGGSALIFVSTKRSKRAARNANKALDVEEKPVEKVNPQDAQASASEEEVEGLAPAESIFTWKDVCYTVPTADGPRQLLHDITGWVKPGETTALMGASGAGKTTLLNTLSQRMNPAQVSGDILVDGKRPGLSFPRETGFAEQMDVHDTTATVREALEFAAFLRQPREVSRKEKLDYVDKIVDLLELNDLQDAIIGTPDAGLTVEQRKRLTIGVELAAKPSLLMFLDEPTSGLDSSGAYQVGRFLRRLGKSGQTVLCTIHQPSSLLFTSFFDRMLLLSPGGYTCYFGPVKDMVAYFEAHGARKCGAEENTAEYALEVVGGQAPKGFQSWHEIWDQSDERTAVRSHVDEIVAERKDIASSTDPAMQREYAAALPEQCYHLGLRVARNFYRDASYGYGKIFTVLIVALFNAFTFFKIGNSINQLQQRMFSIFLIVLIVPALANASIPKHFIIKSYWQARESHSKTYSWAALVTALLVNELPYALICGLLYWVTWYWPVGFPLGEPAGLTFMQTVLFNIFIPGWIHWLCSIAMSPTFVANVLPAFLVVLNLINGIIVPWAQLTPPWKYFVYWANPVTYFLGSELAALIHNVPVECAPQEFATFNPPPGMTCGDYAGAFAQQVQGSLQNPAAMAACKFCQYTVGDQYLESINIQYDDRWRYFGIFASFCIANFVLAYVLFYLCQIKQILAWATPSNLNPLKVLKGVKKYKGQPTA